MKHWISVRWLSFVAVGMLVALLLPVFGVTGEFPYAYYQLMNWVVLGAAVVVALNSYKYGQQVTAWLFAAVAVIFNPVAPLYLTPIVWAAADVFVGVIFVIGLFTLRTH